ncbi:LysR family transcriptional regulator [Alkaliphilus peptidifermentans]|uniref:DNA-binding transcriptional regulator, LysR family n=1 Tax=Alkaliphilus peptidifermentans DSM 18978 TaxID=1120976 RepID=A0A1G5K8T3_9FIRM|nr:LysR family transcriptional regulator [Alkaliphilus peptidifermentans]SCY96349.1 DNA-binding transcriptional regulator, LysR family [Alkaliphilus peptidifermentans DSM 18978]
MDIRQLRYFISVAEHLSFTEASKQLFVAQSAVSQQIADLEKKIGVQLFIRNKRSVRLTNAGTVLFKEAVNLVNKTEEAIEKTRQADLGIVGNLKVGFIGYTEKNFLPYLIRHFRRNYPKVELQLNQLNHGMLIEGLKNGELDIGFTLFFGVDNIGGLESKHIFTETISIVMHCDHPLANEDSINLSRLSDENFIALNRHESPQGYNKTLLMCANSGFSPNIVSEPKLIQTVLLLVDSGMGIAILPNSLKLQASSSLHFIDIEGERAKDELVVAWKKSNTNPSIPLFLDEVESVKLKYHEEMS